ncbi:MAG: hypothetical protein AAFQ20_12720, partial [Bacteroidota bacterium]
YLIIFIPVRSISPKTLNGYVMTCTNLLLQIESFLECPKTKRLELQFAHLDVLVFSQGNFLKPTTYTNCSVSLFKTHEPHRLRMRVKHNLMFSFSFVFTTPGNTRRLQMPKQLLFYFTLADALEHEVQLVYLYGR